MALLSICIPFLLLMSQGKDDSVPSPVHPLVLPAPAIWKIRESVRLELPAEASLLYHSGTILDDGRLVLKVYGDPRILLFGADGRLENSWLAPTGHGRWKNLTYGEFIGASEETLLYRMDRIPGLEDRGRTYKLWGRDIESEPVFTKQTYLDIWATGAGYQAWDSPHIQRLDGEFKALGPVLGEDGLPATFSNYSGFAVPTAGGVLLLTGWDELPRYTHHADGKDRSVPFCVHRISSAGRLIETVKLPLELSRRVAAVLPHDRRLLVGLYVEEKTHGPKNSLHDLDIETGKHTSVLLEQHPNLRWKPGTRRFLDGGRAFRILDPQSQELVTFEVPDR